jgi:hypothetical protein
MRQAPDERCQAECSSEEHLGDEIHVDACWLVLVGGKEMDRLFLALACKGATCAASTARTKE